MAAERRAGGTARALQRARRRTERPASGLQRLAAGRRAGSGERSNSWCVRSLAVREARGAVPATPLWLHGYGVSDDLRHLIEDLVFLYTSSFQLRRLGPGVASKVLSHFMGSLREQGPEGKLRSVAGVDVLQKHRSEASVVLLRPAPLGARMQARSGCIDRLPRAGRRPAGIKHCRPL